MGEKVVLLDAILHINLLGRTPHYPDLGDISGQVALAMGPLHESHIPYIEVSFLGWVYKGHMIPKYFLLTSHFLQDVITHVTMLDLSK